MNGEKKNRFNIIDAIIVALVLVCILSVVFRSFELKKLSSGVDLEEYTLYFKVDNIRSSSLEYFISGDSVRIKSSNKVLGIFEEIIQHVPAVGAYNDNGGEVFYPELEGDDPFEETRYSVFGSISVMGKMTDSGFFLGGEIYLAPNGVLSVVTEHLETQIKITSIVEK